MTHELENTWIKCESKEHGKRIIEFFESKGVRNSLYWGNAIDSYYGVIRGRLSCDDEDQLPPNAKIITLPFQPKRGDKVMVRDNDYNKWEERIYLTAIEGSKYPYLIVARWDESEFENGEEFEAEFYEQMKPLEESILELTIKEIAEKFGVDPERVRVKE